jgi:predicted nucleotidyltransferase
MSRLTRDHETAIRTLAKSFDIDSVRLFGSNARGTASASSDVDLLIRFSHPSSLLKVIGFKQAVEEAIGLKVDVVEEGGLSPHYRDSILSEAMPL